MDFRHVSGSLDKEGQLLTRQLGYQKKMSTLHSISNTQQTGRPDEKEESIANADTKGALSLKN